MTIYWFILYKIASKSEKVYVTRYENLNAILFSLPLHL
jgi:hypothetical protein